MTGYVKYLVKVVACGFLMGLPASVGAMEHEEHEIFKAIEEGDENTVSKILERGFDLTEIKNRDGKPVLHVAIYQGKKNIVALLLDNKCDVNSQDDQYDCSPLHIACQNESKVSSEILTLLLQRNANPNVTTASGLSPLYYAANKGPSFITPLIEFGANVSMQHASTGGRTAVCGMLERCDFESIKFICDAFDLEKFKNLTLPELVGRLPASNITKKIKNQIVYCLLIIKNGKSIQKVVALLPKQIVFMIFKHIVAEPVFVKERVLLDKVLDRAYQQADLRMSKGVHSTADHDVMTTNMYLPYEEWKLKAKELNVIAPYFETAGWDCSLVPHEEVVVEKQEAFESDNSEAYELIEHNDNSDEN